jgi:hypothetical protein
VENEQAKAVKAGYRTIGVLFVVGVACIGFARLEDRAIIGPPGSPANAMAAFAAAGPSDEAAGESYEGDPENVISLDRASRAPSSRIRRILRDSSVPNVAARQILGPPPSGSGPAAGGSLQPETSPAIAPALAAIEAPVPTFASLAPALPGTGTPVFAADGTPGGGGGTGGGGGGGGGNPTDPTDPVSPVPEPSTWLMLILGLFGVGAALRHNRGLRAAPLMSAT